MRGFLTTAALALFALSLTCSLESFAEKPSFQKDGLTATFDPNESQSNFLSLSIHLLNKGPNPETFIFHGVTPYMREGLYKKEVIVPPGVRMDVQLLPPMFYPLGQAGFETNVIPWKQISYSLNGISRTTIPEPLSWRLLCGIDTLRLKREEWQTLSEQDRQAILDWVNLGGNLQIKAPKTMRSSIVEQYPPFSFSSTHANDGYGRGTLSLELHDISSSDFINSKIIASKSGNLEKLKPGWEVKKIPTIPFVVAIAFFGLLIGPGVVMVSHRCGLPSLSLILLPLVSIVACSGLALVVLLGDGITPKLCKQSMSYLDQRSGKAYTQEIFGVEAPIGLFQTPSLPEDALICLGTEEANGGTFIASDGRLHLKGIVLPRTPFLLRTAKFEQRKELLEVTEADGSIKVVNKFGTPLKGLLLRDATGGGWTLKGELPPGSEAQLAREPNFAKTYGGFERLRLSDTSVKAEAPLDLRCYQAELEDDIFGEEFIKNAHEVGDNFHYVVGRY